MKQQSAFNLMMILAGVVLLAVAAKQHQPLRPPTVYEVKPDESLAELICASHRGVTSTLYARAPHTHGDVLAPINLRLKEARCRDGIVIPVSNYEGRDRG